MNFFNPIVDFSHITGSLVVQPINIGVNCTAKLLTSSTMFCFVKISIKVKAISAITALEARPSLLAAIFITVFNIN